MKEEPASLLDKYYEGLTTSGEELRLREAVAGSDEEIPEKDIFRYYLSRPEIPEGLEEGLFEGVDRKIRHRTLRLRIIRWSAAAVLLLLAGVFGWVTSSGVWQPATGLGAAGVPRRTVNA